MARGADEADSSVLLFQRARRAHGLGDERRRAYILLASKMMKLWALALASAGSVSALLPVIVPMSDNTNDTLLTWGPVTADISANRCRAFAVAFEGGKAVHKANVAARPR